MLIMYFRTVDGLSSIYDSVARIVYAFEQCKHRLLMKLGSKYLGPNNYTLVKALILARSLKLSSSEFGHLTPNRCVETLRH